MFCLFIVNKSYSKLKWILLLFAKICLAKLDLEKNFFLKHVRYIEF